MVRLDWDRTALPGICPPGFYTLHIDPEPGHPFGRKGLALDAAWRRLSTRGCCGLVILDGDVAIDPADRQAMLQAVDRDPHSVHVAPVKLWPASTKQKSWVHGHGAGGQFSQKDTDTPDTFGFSFTYLPRKLITACQRAGLAKWAYPDVDRNTRLQAAKLPVPVSVVRAATPKHLNY
jgi:hypothetical protein